MRHTISHGTSTEVKVVRPRGEVILVALEELAILGVLGIFITGIVMRHGDVWNYAGMPLVSGIVCWVNFPHPGNVLKDVRLMEWQAYILVLATVRLWYSGSKEYDLLSLWDHTSLLYLLNFIFATVAFRTALIHPKIGIQEALTITQFTLMSLLCVTTLSSRRGNKPVKLEVVDGLEPSREPLASLFSLATFSWVDGIVWQGYWKPFELEEVWNLREDDIAYSVLSTFRQTKYVDVLEIYYVFWNNILTKASGKQLLSPLLW